MTAIGLDDGLRVIFDAANDDWKRKTGAAWHAFFIDGVAFQADWLGACRPGLTATYLRALADLHDTDPASYARLRQLVDVHRRVLLESFEAGAAERSKQ